MLPISVLYDPGFFFPLSSAEHAPQTEALFRMQAPTPPDPPPLEAPTEDRGDDGASSDESEGGGERADPRYYVLVAADSAGDAGKFRISKPAMLQSELLRSIVESSDAEEDDAEAEAEEEVPLPNVKSRELAKIVEFCEHHVDHEVKEIPKPLPDGNFDQYVTEWDAAFVARIPQHEELFELIEAAHYMDLKTLMELGAAKVASMIRGKTPEEIRELFNIENDFTPEEEAQIREENRWCEEI